jgi:hypothetical protein
VAARDDFDAGMTGRLLRRTRLTCYT